MNILVLEHYASRPNLTRWNALAKKLIQRGHSVVVVAASTVHNTSTNLLSKGERSRLEEVDGIPFLYVYARSYQGNGFKRVLNMADYCAHSIHETLALPVPDVIVASSPQPLTLFAGIRLGKRLGVPCVCEVRDLWPQSPIEYGYVSESGLAAKALRRGERWAYESADALVFTMEGGAEYIADQGWDSAHGGSIDLGKVNHINNGVDVAEFDRCREEFPYENDALAGDGERIVVYAGSVRRANDLGFVLDVAKLLRGEHVRFVIIGDGDEREALEARARDEGIANVAFVGRIDKRYIPSALSQGMMMMMMYSRSQRGLSRYGMSQNKLFDYLAAGKPVLSNLPSNHSIVNGYGCGFEGAFESPSAMAEKVIEMLADDDQLKRWGANARKAAGDFDFDVLTERYLAVMEGVLRH